MNRAGVERLRAEPLTAGAFAPFGEVIAAAEAAEVRTINLGYARRFHDLARLDLDTDGGRPVLSLFRVTPVPDPIRIARMERHPLSSQAFYPLGGRPWLVVVAPPGVFDPGALRAFLARADQGVNYRPGTWHHFCLALEAETDFLVIDRDGPGPDCDEVSVEPPREVIVAAV